MTATRLITDSDRFVGKRATLRLLTLDDCTPRYTDWLADPDVNQFLETRWSEQTPARIREFVDGMRQSEDSYLFAILDNADGMHVGNIKIGPINRHHGYADVSYFIGERDRWGRGIASDAIALAVQVGFERLGLRRAQAGVYESNAGSSRALERVGFVREATLRKQLRAGDNYEDHYLYGLLREEWKR